MLRYGRSFALFWYDFIVGDDWTIAVGVAVIMAVAWFLNHVGVDTWLLFVVAMAGVLVLSIRRAVRHP